MLYLALLALLLQPVLSIVVLVPLYVYPDTNAAAWQSLFTIISRHPKVHYLIIINPNSGPGSGDYPDENYVAGVSRLSTYKNVEMIGYVDTQYTNNPVDMMKSQIDQYVAWGDYQANITLNGIFFDDATHGTDQSDYEYMSAVSSHAYSAFAAKNKNRSATVVFNPGCHVDNQYFNYANYIVEYESPMAEWKGLAPIKRIRPRMRQKQAIIMNSVSPSSTNISNVVTPMYKQTIGAVYMTNQCCYNAIDFAQLTKLSSTIASLQRKQH